MAIFLGLQFFLDFKQRTAELRFITQLCIPVLSNKLISHFLTILL